MFDDLRERSTSPFDEAVEPIEGEPAAEADDGDRIVLGMNSLQRFVIVLMLFLNVALFGCACLLATGRIASPF